MNAQLQHTALDELQRKVGKAKSLLILDHPFFGTACTKRPIIYTDTVPTAAMSATGQMYMNVDFCAPLSVQQLMFLLAHEAMHYMLAHGLRRGHRDPQAWNVAADKVINDTLIDAGVGDFIDGGITLDGAREMAAESLYDENDDGDGEGPGGLGNDIGDPTDADGQPLDDATIHQLEAEAKIDAIQSAKAAKAVGKLPASIERIIEELVNVTTPWYDILERFMAGKIKDGYSWNRPNRRFIARNIYIPGTDYVPKMGPIVIGVDTSGSIGPDEIAMFNGHINRIIDTCNPEVVHVVYCDYDVAGVDEYTPEDFPVTIQCKGGGGTSFKPVFDWIDNNAIDPECVVYLTDGYGDQSEFTTNHETVWLTTGTEAFDWGHVIKFEE
ncbi:VWA-like domain-containing protein [bacterium]|nr:VWA-like domain-containing protein [bacterium]